MTNELTLENIRSGAFPSDAHAVGFLLGEIEKLNRKCSALAYLQYGSAGPDDPWQGKLDEVTKPLHADIEHLTLALVQQEGTLNECEALLRETISEDGVYADFDSRLAAYWEKSKALADWRTRDMLIAQRPTIEPKACETFPGEVHPLGKLTNLICDVIEHARDSSPHSNEFEALVQTMWDEYNAKLLAQGASRDASNHDQGSLTEAGCSPAAQSCEWTATAGNPDDDSQRTGPADLVGALQDVVHTDPGPVRAAAAVKSIECPQCFGDKQIAMSDWTSRFCEYCGGTGRVALKSLEQPVATPGATQAEDAVIITAVSSGPRGLLASETASFAKTLARSPRIISRGASRGHHCLDCGADLSNHPTAASAHRCSPQRT